MIEAFGLSDVGCVRQNNEDAFAIDPALGLCLLADGMGGAQAGELASRIAVDTVIEFLRASPNRDASSLVGAFEEANRQVLARAASQTAFAGMGTTLVGILRCDDRLAIASVGDSRAYVFGHGKLSPITEDQTWANEVGRRLGLNDERLKHHPMRHVLTMAIGVEVPLRIHSYEVLLTGDVLFLLCSDGLHGVISAEDISAGLQKVGTLEDKCHYLVEAARVAGAPDNVTVVLLRATI